MPIVDAAEIFLGFFKFYCKLFFNFIFQLLEKEQERSTVVVVVTATGKCLS